MGKPPIRIGIDAGGTFTDCVIHDPVGGALHIRKLPSTAQAPERAVMAALALADRLCGPIGRVVHGTTVGTNALLEGRGARLALLTTAGFRDLLEIGRTRRPAPGLFDTSARKPPPLIERRHRLEVVERLGPDGTVWTPLDPASLARACAKLAQIGPEAVVICFLHAWANPDHERQARAAVERALPGVPVQISADLLPVPGEFERLAASTINAYLRPRMARYLEALDRQLAERNTTLQVMGSNGGAMTAAHAALQPIRTILSGPAGGIQGARHVCRAAKVADFITCDMGGTSTDVCLVQDLIPGESAESRMAGLPLTLPQIDIHTVGAGGGSLARWEPEGLLRVGPESAGARPGPAAYGLGGTEMTLTDAALLLGWLGESSLAGGAVRLDREAARRAATDLGRQAGIDDPLRLAEGIVRIAVTHMAMAIREISLARGHDPQDFTLVPMGGAGPMFATLVAMEMGMRRVLVPLHPGNLSALGLIAADLRHDVVQSHGGRAADADPHGLAEAFARMRQSAAWRLVEDGFPAGRQRFHYALDLRHAGHAEGLTVPLRHAGESMKAVVRRFEERFETRFGLGKRGGAVEVAALRVVALGRVVPPALPPWPRQRGPVRAMARRVLHLEGRRIGQGPIYDRAALGAGARLDGPAIIEEYGSTTVVAPGWRARVDALGNLRLTMTSDDRRR
ncbi:MAG: hydantoinase/oxoprolinase family protein [Rhodospirillales bacterium]|nr:hydantoinase/oxoprolinase family protein [Rhodospirillales bacterium]